jgi:hypothetical protein
MPDFKSLKALEKYLKKAIKESIKEEPTKAVKNLMRKHILRDVYMVYKPKEYQRRLISGGLYDEKNIVIKPKRNNTVEIFNKAKRNMNNTNLYLAPIIEFGHKKAVADGYKGYSYEYPHLRYYHPRPFIENTRESLKENKQHVKAMKQNLKKYGIDSVDGG